MSYDLYFCRERERGFQPSELEHWAKSVKNLRASGDSQFWYENERTGVYFSLELGFESEQETFIPQGFIDVGLAFNMNYYRPTFFGSEAMPIIERLQSDLDLLVVNPQAEDDENLPRKYGASELFATWSKTNQSSFEILIREGVAPNIRLENRKSLEAWKYNYSYEELELLAADFEAFVPKIAFIRVPQSDQAQTAFVWSLGISTLVPATDWIVIVREQKRILGKLEQEIGAIPGSKVLDLVSPQLVNLGSQVSGQTLLLPPKNVGKASDILRKVPLELRKGEFEVLPAEKLRDVE